MPARPTSHPAADVLVAFSQGKLEDTAASAVMTHLDSCPACCQAVAEASGDSFLERLRAARSAGGTPVPTNRSAAAEGSKSKGSQPGPPASAVDPSIPAELRDHPQYEVVRELGRGGMGVVYLATNKLMQRPEVLKVMNKTLLDRDGAGERFLREIRAAARLNHPNVATAYTALQVGDLLVFAMEYVEGENLAQVVKARGPLPVVAACYYVQQAALGLQHAFENAMVHRDIKPQNLMVTRRHKRLAIKVLDFGLAKVLREKDQDTGLTGEGKMLGTPDYVAPEQIQDAAHADIRADIYSLGGTLYYLLSGGPPFREGNLWGLLQAHMSREAEPLDRVRSEVPAELAAVVARMMAKDPAERYQTPVEVAQALVPFVKPGSQSTESSQGEKAEREASQGSKIASGIAPGSLVAKEGKIQRPAKVEEKPPAAWDTRTDKSSTSTGSGRSAGPRRPRPAPQPAPWRRPLLAASGATGVLLLILVGLWAGGVFKLKTPKGTIIVENVPADAEVQVEGQTVTLTRNGESVTVTAVSEGPHRLKVAQGGQEIWSSDVTVKVGGNPVRLRMEPRVPGLPRRNIEIKELTPAKPTAEGTAPEGLANAPAGRARKVPAYEHGLGEWRIEGDELIQGAANEGYATLLFGEATWTDYDMTVDARRIEGESLCGVAFRAQDVLNYWNLRAWSQARTIGLAVDGKYTEHEKDGWSLDDDWHTIRVQLRGQSILCFMDGQRVFEFNDDRHPAGYVALGTAPKTATRFRNLKVTDARGLILVDGIGNLSLESEQAGTSVHDLVKPGTVWRGKVKYTRGGKPAGENDSLQIKILKREGTKFAGELWTNKPRPQGMKIEGRVDPKGNITWRATEFLVQGSLIDENLTTLALGIVKGKQLRGYARFPTRDLIAEVTATRDD